MNTTATADVAALRAQMIADIEKRLDELYAMLDIEKLVIGSHNWVVTNAIGFLVKFDIDRDGMVRGASVTNLEGATRLTRADAQILAAKMRDGKGDCGKAMPVVEAIKAQIADHEKAIDDLTAD